MSAPTWTRCYVVIVHAHYDNPFSALGPFVSREAAEQYAETQPQWMKPTVIAVEDPE